MDDNGRFGEDRKKINEDEEERYRLIGGYGGREVIS